MSNKKIPNDDQSGKPQGKSKKAPKDASAVDPKTPDSIKKQIDQICNNQIDVLKMMNDFNSRLGSIEVENQKLFHVLAMLTKNQDEFRSVLDMLGRGMKQLKKQLEEGMDEGDGDDELPEENQKKDPPLHDDVTITCSVCDRVYNSRLEKCPRCGFHGNKNKKKGR